MTYEPHDLFLNTNTNEVDTYYNLSTYETDANSMIEMTDEEFEQKKQEALSYFEDMENDGTYVQVWEAADENGNPLNYFVTEDGERVGE